MTMDEVRRARCGRWTVYAALPVVAVAALFVPDAAQAQASLGPTGPFAWQHYAGIAPAHWAGQIVIKFRAQTQPRLQGTRVAFGEGAAELDLAGLFPEGTLLDLDQGFGQAPETLRSLRAAGEQRCGCDLADLWSYVMVRVDADKVDLEDALERLNALQVVELAYPRADSRLFPPPWDIPPATPGYGSDQGHLDQAPGGVDARFAWSIPGGRGEHATIVDMEGDWDASHEDLEACLNGEIYVGSRYTTEPALTNHGTAVLGELFGGDNDYGVTGIVPSAGCHFVADWTWEYSEDYSRALLAAAEVLAPQGTVLLLEAHIPGPNYDPYDPNVQNGFVPVEWDPAVYDTLRTLSANGYTIVEAAGNGAQNLDGSEYYGRFDRGSYDSGAIIVGAGESAYGYNPRAPEYFTNWGSRVDLQGWGTYVTTTGYGDLFDGSGDVHQQYTAQFSGTSSASPIVTGSVAAVLSASFAATGEHMTTAEVRDLLIETGTPQVVPEQHIGPLPNLRAALDVLVGYCGDGNLGGEEVCDDGNEVGGDGCSSDCASDERCGNSIVDTPAGEACDDGNTWSGDGCSSDCWSNETCGNGTVDPELGETCDDGNLDDGDGCTSGCRVDRSPSDDDQDPDDPSGHPVDDDAAGDEDDGGAGWIGSANPVPGMVGGPGCHVAGATPSAGAWHDAFLGLLILAMLRLGGRRR